MKIIEKYRSRLDNIKLRFKGITDIDYRQIVYIEKGETNVTISNNFQSLYITTTKTKRINFHYKRSSVRKKQNN